MDLPEELIRLQHDADDKGRTLEHLDDVERQAQRDAWFEAAAKVEAAVTAYAQEQGLNRHDVAKALRQAARRPHSQS
ncbi:MULTISPECIES: hypothetical protein [unclassified Streptomyces]|uniref:hypothetical protein n=1 Tax=unclassified Streptomyces TaxID=2593676 RepID=UPI002DD8492E|nr:MULTISPECIES: hypothetical protein [unclassified Streptomyces]WSE09012.1 hypothetical protein OG574_39995 [Streptomyces sp. NBC_01445]